jgi:hypothetical protein
LNLDKDRCESCLEKQENKKMTASRPTTISTQFHPKPASDFTLIGVKLEEHNLLHLPTATFPSLKLDNSLKLAIIQIPLLLF